VNVPGFPIPRPSLAAAAGRQISLVAAEPVVPTDRTIPSVNALAAAVEKRLEQRATARNLHDRQTRERAAAVMERMK